MKEMILNKQNENFALKLDARDSVQLFTITSSNAKENVENWPLSQGHR